MLFSTIHSFGQGNYIGYKIDCLDIIGNQVQVCIKAVIGAQRYTELLNIRQKERKSGVISIYIDTTGKATHTVHDKYLLLTKKEKRKLDKKIAATYFDFCIHDWWDLFYYTDDCQLRERTKEEIFKLHPDGFGVGVPFPYIPFSP